ncbi:unnamed protein product [Fusarium equiseti]|uniref:Uncharacterized protein n=1 Tax=Fusarium equiseti TaxID=61235 RepID=A0A8J2N9G0_FUSEQ|nr:unnamed protein product [Fusarium equiseti]
MVKLLSLAVVTVALLAPISGASNCTPGLRYCGYVLLRVGNYKEQIIQALRAEGQDFDWRAINTSYFDCLGGSNGDIKWLSNCRTCVDNGYGNSDTCLT